MKGKTSGCIKLQNRILFFPFLILCLFSFTHCGFNTRVKKDIDISDNELWFLLNKGKIDRITDLPHIQSDSLLPWTVQERITDIVICNNRLYLAVNGYGLASYQALGKSFKTYYDPGYFEFKTMTTIMAVPGTDEKKQNMNSTESILCHLYFNSMVFPFQIDDFLFDSANLIKLTHTKEELLIEELYPLTPEIDPYWEIVRFLPLSRDTFNLEWKNSQKLFSEFKYSCFSINEKKEEEKEWEDFLSAYNFIPIEGEKTAGSLKHLCEKVIEDGARRTKYTTFHFLVKDTVTHMISRYKNEASVPLTDENFEIVSIRMLKDEKGYYALTDPGIVYFTRYDNQDDDMRIRKIFLPSLPAGFRFTDFFVFDNKLFITWEESKFVNVGAAGLLIMKDTNLI